MEKLSTDKFVNFIYIGQKMDAWMDDQECFNYPVMGT